MYLLDLPRRVGETVENANRSISELRSCITSLLFPMKLLLWFCMIVVIFDLFYNNTINESFTYRTICGIIDQLWYVIFYFSVPLFCNNLKKKVETIYNNDHLVFVDEFEEPSNDDDWIIIEKSDI